MLRSKPRKKLRPSLDANQKRWADDFLSRHDVIDERVARELHRDINARDINMQVEFRAVKEYCNDYVQRVRDVNF